MIGEDRLREIRDEVVPRVRASSPALARDIADLVSDVETLHRELRSSEPAIAAGRSDALREKAGRLLREGRLRVVRRPDPDTIEAVCDGDHGRYELGYDDGSRQWRCSCPAYGDRCSHLLALKLVTVELPRPSLDTPPDVPPLG